MVPVVAAAAAAHGALGHDLDGDGAHLFGRLPAGFPLINARHTPYRPDGTPILTGTTYSRPDRFVVEVTIKK